MSRSQLKLIVALVGASLALAGCNIGDAPPALTPQETQKAVANLPPQQQIDYINRSGMPAAEKEKRISDIKAKAGMK